MRGQQHFRPANAHAVEALARWWSQASQEERFALVRAAIHGEAQAPPLRELQLAIFLAEEARGEVTQG